MKVHSKFNLEICGRKSYITTPSPMNVVRKSPIILSDEGRNNLTS